jgi:Ca2+/Na+ antiporter
MKKIKISKIIFWLLIFVLTAMAAIWIWLNKDGELGSVTERVITLYFTILATVISVFQLIDQKKDEAESKQYKMKNNKTGNVIIPFFVLSLFFIPLSFLLDFSLYLKILGIGICAVCAIWIIFLGILSKQSLRGQENYIVQPEKFWRMIWNMLPARWGYENNPILNVLIIYSKEGEEQAKQTREKYKQAENELRIDCHLCEVNKKEQLDNKLNTTKYIGVHLIYTEDIKNDMLWVRELLFEWASKNKSKPIVYTNYTTDEQPLNYGTSSKNSDGIIRLFQRTHTLSELWQEQSNIQHKFFKWLSVFLILFFAGLIFMLFKPQKNNEQLILVGGGTVKEYLKKNIDTKEFSKDDLIFIPTPTGIGCEKLGDEGFTNQLQSRVIIMSSAYQEREDSIVIKNFRLDRNTTVKHILEIFLCRDTFYIKSKGINGFDTLGIKKSELIEKIEKDNSIKRIFHTNKESGTYKFYKNVIDAAEKKSLKNSVYYADEKDEAFNRQNNYIILTRTFYDPIPKPRESITKINMLDSLGYPEQGNLFLYIPITEEEIKKNCYVLPEHVQKFLESIQKEEGKVNFPKEIDNINGYDIMIRDTTYKVNSK